MSMFLKILSLKLPMPKKIPKLPISDKIPVPQINPLGMISKIFNFKLGPWFWVVVGLLGLLLILSIILLVKKIFFSK